MNIDLSQFAILWDKLRLTMKTILLDIMLNGRFYKQLRYKFASVFILDLNEVEAFVLERLPSLRGKDYNIVFSDNAV